MKMLTTLIVRLISICLLTFFFSLSLSLIPVSSFAANVKIERVSFLPKSVSDNKAPQRDNTLSLQSQDEQQIPVVWIRIQGAGFSPDIYVNHVLIDQQKIPVIKATPNEILSILPATVSPGDHSLTVSVDKDTAVKDVKIGKEIGKTGPLNFSAEQTEQSAVVYLIPDGKAVYAFSKNEYFSIYSVQSLDKPSNSSSDGIFLKEMKILKPVQNLAAYVEKNNFSDQNNYIFSLSEVQKFSPGTSLMVAALLGGNSTRLNNFDVHILIRNSDGNIIDTGQPLVQSIKFDRSKDHFDNYEALVYFVFPLPSGGLSESVQIEFLIDTPTSRSPLVNEVKRLTAESRAMPTFTFEKAFLSINESPSFLKEEVDYFNLSPVKSFEPGQHIALINLFSFNNAPSKVEDLINCGFDITKNNKNIVSYSTSILKPRGGLSNGCVFNFIAPEELMPGSYSVYPWLKTTTGTQVTRADSFEITVLPYQPSIELNTWIVSPLNLREVAERVGDFRDQTMVLLANMLTESKRNKQIGLLTDIETKGFSSLAYSDNKHILQYSLVLMDKKGKEYKKSEKYGLDRVNGNLRLYITLTVPQNFESGPVKSSLEVEIDGIKAQGQNTFNLL